jgi:hypothetical protein
MEQATRTDASATGLTPALQFWHPDVTAALKQQAPVVTGGSLRLRRASVVAQIAISLLLLAGAGLFVHTLQQLKAQDVGFATDHLVTFAVDPRLAGYDSIEAAELYPRILENLRSLAGVRFAAATRIEPVIEANHRDVLNKSQMGVWVAHKLCSDFDEIEPLNCRHISSLDMSESVRRTIQQWDGKSFYAP